jgi:hypothetical protein
VIGRNAVHALAPMTPVPARESGLEMKSFAGFGD